MQLRRPTHLLLLAALMMLPTELRAQSRDLLAHGSGERLWLAQIVETGDEQTPGERTILRTRQIGTGDTQWVELARISGRVDALANRHNDVVAKLGQRWLIIWRGAGTSGPPLPDGRRLLALASDETTLWALGGSVDAPAPEMTQESAEGLEAAPSRPLQRPGVSSPQKRPSLFLLDRGRWSWKADLPTDVAADDVTLDSIALGVIKTRPMLAIRQADQHVATLELAADGSWIDRGTIEPVEPGPIKVLAAGSQPALWAAGSGGAGSVYLLGERWSAPAPLQVGQPVREPDGRALAAVGANLRFFFIDNDRVHEQSFGLDGQPIGEVAELSFPHAPAAPPSHWPTVALMAALMFILFGTIRRRAMLPGGMVDASKVPQAPLMVRLFAAAIDLLPVLVAAGIVGSRQQMGDDPAEMFIDIATGLPVLIVLAVYLAYTCVAEYLTGRTLGKRLLGLRVAGLDGGRASAGAIVARNLLRVIDLFAWPVSLMLLVFSPLQQRVGDIAAGTVVVLNKPPESDEDKDQKPGKSEKDESDAAP